MKIYITNYSKNIERLKKLECDPELIGKNIRWVNEWDQEDLFVKWVKWYTKSDQTTGHLSNFLKHMWCLNDMLKNNIEEAIILEDDVVFETNWLEKFELTRKKQQHFKYIKMGCSGQAGLVYQQDKFYLLNNFGGSEAQFVHQDFAYTTLKNLDFQHSIDIFYVGILFLAKFPGEPCIPVCSQTSLYENITTTGTNESKIDWKDYVINFPTYKKYIFQDLLAEFEKFKFKKEQFEYEFNERFNYKIECNNFDLI